MEQYWKHTKMSEIQLIGKLLQLNYPLSDAETPSLSSKEETSNYNSEQV